MITPWVVLLEAQADDALPALTLSDLEGMVALLADHSPSGLWSARRYALQFVVPAESPAAAVAPTLTRWRATLARLGLREWPIVRLEIKTLAELAAESKTFDEQHGLDRGPTSGDAVRAAYLATRQLLSVRTRQEAASIVRWLARRLGAELVPPDHDGGVVMPLDLSLGAADPVCASADPISISQLELEEVLPTVVLDALRVLSLCDGEGTDPGEAGADAPVRTRDDTEIPFLPRD
jgi:hypothetical protein